MIIFLNFEIPKIIKIRRRIWKIFETFFHVIERVWFYFMYYPKFAIKQEIAVKRAVALSLIQIGEKCTKKVITFSGSQVMHGFTLSIFTKLTTAWRNHM